MTVQYKSINTNRYNHIKQKVKANLLCNWARDHTTILVVWFLDPPAGVPHEGPIHHWILDPNNRPNTECKHLLAA